MVSVGLITSVGIVGALTEIRHTETFKRYKDIYDKNICIKQVKKLFGEIFRIKNISCASETGKIIYPGIRSVTFNEYGFIVDADISLVCDFNTIENIKDYIKATFRAYKIQMEESKGIVIIKIYKEPLEDKLHHKIALSPYQLLLGYNYDGNIIADMKKAPHILICGLSNSGKTQMAKTIINNLHDADIVLLNAFKEDFKDHKGQFIIGDDNILEFLNSCLDGEIRKRPVYVIIDELLVLCKNKEITKVITDLLAVARHFNIFLIAISQIGTKEQLKFKDLFNCRICMRAIEESSYRVVLGCGVDGALKQREFYLYSDGLHKGRTFTNRE